jgi:hypothetical protein
VEAQPARRMSDRTAWQRIDAMTDIGEFLM